jgi:hypothetical protein
MVRSLEGAFGRAYGSDEIFDGIVIFHAGRAFNPATNVDRVRRHRRDRWTNVLRVQSAGQNQESCVAHRSPCSGPIARLTRAAPELGVVRIDEYIAFRERCCVFWLELRIGCESANHTKFASQFVARFRRCMSMQLNASNACSCGELANFWFIRVDENADGASSCWERVHNSADHSRFDVARARWIKVEPNHVRAEFDARACIVRICNTADFDLCRVHHGNHKRAGVW